MGTARREAACGSLCLRKSHLGPHAGAPRGNSRHDPYVAARTCASHTWGRMRERPVGAARHGPICGRPLVSDSRSGQFLYVCCGPRGLSTKCTCGLLSVRTCLHSLPRSQSVPQSAALQLALLPTICRRLAPQARAQPASRPHAPGKPRIGPIDRRARRGPAPALCHLTQRGGRQGTQGCPPLSDRSVPPFYTSPAQPGFQCSSSARAFWGLRSRYLAAAWTATRLRALAFFSRQHLPEISLPGNV